MRQTYLRSKRARKILLGLFTALVASMAYTCVYAYRKPFTVGNFSETYGGVTMQTLLIIFQVIGYMLSKFAGIRFISGLSRKHRFLTAIVLILIAWFSLLAFALVFGVASLICLLINGFALGFMWGVIFSYVEGRTTTDFIGTVMAVSFIFAGGFTRSVATWLMVEVGVADLWMPFVTGLIFFFPLLILLVLLEKLPSPDVEDQERRVKREPMGQFERKQMMAKMGSGLIVLVATYVLLTIIRDIRDNYMSNIWIELGFADDYAVFTRTELVTSLVVLFIMSLFVLVKNNFIALRVIHWIMLSGLLVSVSSTLLFIHSIIDGAYWMQLVGIGLYMSYIPFNCILFERMIAAFRLHGTAGFLMYLADSFGYLGSTGIMLGKELTSMDITWSVFYSKLVIVSGVMAIGGIIYSYFFFKHKYSCIRKQQSSWVPAS